MATATATRGKGPRPKPYDTALSAKGGSALYTGSGEWYVIHPSLKAGIYKLGYHIETAHVRLYTLIIEKGS